MDARYHVWWIYPLMVLVIVIAWVGWTIFIYEKGEAKTITKEATKLMRSIWGLKHGDSID